MPGLFDILSMFGPNAANAAGVVPGFDERFGAAFPQNTEVNPNPVAPGTVPLPTPAPPELSAPPAVIAGANRGVGAVPLNRGVPEQDVGAALAAPDVASLEARAPTLGAEGPVAPESVSTDISAQSRGEQRPSLAQALRGVQAPRPPELQRIATPNAPRATGTIKGGDLQALLMALNAGGGAPGRPVRLGG